MSLFRGTAPFALFAVVLPLGASSTVVNGDTTLNIGSITKAFVAELLADEVLRGERCYTDGLHQRLVANGLDESP